MLNLILLTATLSFESSLIDVTREFQQVETPAPSTLQAALIPQTFDQQGLESEIEQQLIQEILKLHQNLNDEIGDNNMWVNK
ncbi:hypothetical protein K0I73_09060 [Shewanella mesophila]|uniref:hypothetical protein n=1 Tax=Shewanella mesophila TaxID=2864208 RepID=UPI001C65CD0B|nr:hypothetical protein [Shewanella mesophila]QYJ87798.1 hypothetical protein K0I73_09060 [Shewanella mesophila]